jgi:carboxymethylenebutenolidase
MTALPQLASDIVGLTTPSPVSRRNFFMSAPAAGAAGYTLAAGPVRADAIKTDTQGITDGEGKIKVKDGEMPCYFAYTDKSRRAPVIIVCQEIFGLHEYIRDVVRRFAKIGAFAVTPDYYFRKGDIGKLTDMKKGAADRQRQA